MDLDGIIHSIAIKKQKTGVSIGIIKPNNIATKLRNIDTLAFLSFLSSL